MIKQNSLRGMRIHLQGTIVSTWASEWMTGNSDDFELFKFQQVHLMNQEDENASGDDSSSDAPQKQTNSTFQVHCTDSSIDSPSSLSSSLSESDWASNQSDNSSSSLERPTSSNEELQDMSMPKTSAHEEGNDSTAMIKIRKPIVQSERTPCQERAESQK